MSFSFHSFCSLPISFLFLRFLFFFSPLILQFGPTPLSHCKTKRLQGAPHCYTHLQTNVTSLKPLNKLLFSAESRLMRVIIEKHDEE